MATSYTSLLGLALPVTGELAGTWGDVVNNSITSLLDTSVAGTTTLSTDADVTLSTTTGASNQARQAILLCSGARTGIRTITAPAHSKIYAIVNNTTGGYAVKIVGVGPTTGVTVANGKTTVVAWNGSDFVEIAPATAASATTATNLAGGTTGSVPYQSGANATTFLSLGTANQILTSSGTAPQWSSSLTVTGLTNSALTSGRVTYATTSGQLTDSANLLYSGTDLTVYGVTVGRGASGIDTNTALGSGAYRVAANTGNTNIAVGYRSLGFSSAGVSGTGNIGIGYLTGSVLTSGLSNTAVGNRSLVGVTTGSENTAIGSYALNASTASNGVGIGANAGAVATTGENNTFVGYNSGSVITTGAKNTIIGGYNGNADGLDIRTASNYAVISDGDGNRLLSMYNGGTLALDGNAVPNAGTGITFPATQSASSDANTLDDYEEGSWTPTQGAGLTVVGSYSSAGRYTKIGRTVTVCGYLGGSTSVAISSPNTVLCGGLPFTAAATPVSTGVLTNNSRSTTVGIFNNTAATTISATGTVSATVFIYFSMTYDV